MSGPALNLAQQEAVNYLHGPCLVLAGAGSGKTRVITHKIARLIQAGLAPRRIAAITFTNKAAAEMRERARGLIGKAAGEVLICTFHALGVRLLREDGATLGLKPQFSILDSDDVLGLLKDCGTTTDAATARQWQWTISLWKNQGLTAKGALAAARFEDERVAARIMARYEERLAAYQSVDFDDLIGLPLKLLAEHAEVRAKWQQRLAHVLVDEYQDTNATQYALLKLLVGHEEKTGLRHELIGDVAINTIANQGTEATRLPAESTPLPTPRSSPESTPRSPQSTPRFTAVGDDDQSIYGWRGATLDNLKKLPQDFPTLKVIKLEQNYRSTTAILRAANNVIAANPRLFAKQLFSQLGDGEPVRVVVADDEAHEAERAVARIQSIRAGSVTGAGAAVIGPGVRKEWRDFAILYRANHLAKPLELALRKAQIPYKVSGGQSLFDKAEIKDLCAWLRLWTNNDDDPAFVRAATVPRRGIGHQTLQSLGSFASRYKISLFEALFFASLSSALPARAVGSLHEFGRQVNDLQYRARHTTGAQAARSFLRDWLADIHYEKYLHDSEDSPKLAAARWANVLDFCDWMAARCGGEVPDMSGADGGSAGQAALAAASAPEKSLLDVAQTISLLSTLSEREQDANVVTLSTLHAAKGLEWPHVVLVGVNEGLLPFRQDDDSPAAAAPSRTTAAARSASAALPPSAGRHGASAPAAAPSPAAQLRIEEERRLMYVGITRAQHSLLVSWAKRRKRGRDSVPAQPSRFIAEMALDATTTREDPREKLRALRAEFARKASEDQARQLAQDKAHAAASTAKNSPAANAPTTPPARSRPTS